jgi:hypothetical protein
MAEHTEYSIANYVMGIGTFQRCDVVCPNIAQLYYWEADLLALTPSLLLHEIEIKTSRKDYRRDPEGSINKQYRHRAYSAQANCPNYFWYAVPDTLAPYVKETMPAYAGLISIKADYILSPAHVVVPAPRLHRKKASARTIGFLHRGVSLRYWQQRMNLQRDDDGNDGRS